MGHTVVVLKPTNFSSSESPLPNTGSQRLAVPLVFVSSSTGVVIEYVVTPLFGNDAGVNIVVPTLTLENDIVYMYAPICECEQKHVF